MLRSIELLRQTATPDDLIVADDGHAMLRGGGGNYDMPWHWHDCMMLLLPSVGAMSLKDEDNRSEHWLSADRFALVPANRAHRTRAFRESHEHIALYVTCAGLDHVEKQLGSLARVRRNSTVTSLFPTTPDMRTLHALCGGARHDALGAAAARSHLGMALLIQCLAAVERGGKLPMASRHTHGLRLVSEIKAHLLTRSSRIVSLDELVTRFKVSRRHLSRLFREHTGASIGEYQAAARIDAARRLLVETELPVAEIAYRSGFDSTAGLARAMRRRDGCSPTDLRASVRMARSAKR